MALLIGNQEYLAVETFAPYAGKLASWTLEGKSTSVLGHFFDAQRSAWSLLFLSNRESPIREAS